MYNRKTVLGAALIALLGFSAFGGGYWYAGATLPTQDGTWGQWIREAYGWFNTALHLDYTTANRWLYVNSGKNVTSSTLGIGSGNDITGVDWMNATSASITNYYLGPTSINARLGGNWGGLDLTNVDDMNSTDVFTSNLYANTDWVKDEAGAYQNRTDAVLHPDIAADYIFTKIGARYAVIDGVTKTVTFNANETTLMQNTINTLTSTGGTILYKPRNVTFTGKLTLKSYVYIMGTSPEKCIMHYNGAGNFISSDTNTYWGGLINLNIDGTSGTGNGVVFNSTQIHHMTLQNLQLTNFKATGKTALYLKNTLYSKFEQIFSSGNDYGMICGDSVGGNTFIQTRFYANRVGQWFTDKDFFSNRIIGMTTGTNTDVGTQFDGGDENTFLACEWEGQPIGIDFNPASPQEVSMNTFEGCNFFTHSTDAIQMTDNEYTKRNRFHDIWMPTGSGGWDIPANPSKNIISDSVISGLTNLNDETIITNVEGYKTENWGSGTVLNGTTSLAVAHGCDFTPSADEVTITWYSGTTNDYGPWSVGSFNATHFVVSVRSDPGASGAGFFWKVERNP